MSALARAFTLAMAMQVPRSQPVLCPPGPVRVGVCRRAASSVPVTLRPIAILAPEPDTDVTVHRFVIQQFTPAAQRLAR